jgi:CRP-like cAMP-binding protein
MPVQSFLNFLAAITPLPPAYISDVERSLHTEHYKSRQIFHAAGQTENRLWFIEKGFARSYYFDPAGKEHTLVFYKENDLIFSYKGYWSEPTDYYLEALQPSSLISLAYGEMSKIFPLAETKALVQYFIRQRNQQDIFKSRIMGWSAEERYKQFRKVYPEIFRMASVRVIATYLNMTRENLSRLMGRNIM